MFLEDQKEAQTIQLEFSKEDEQDIGKLYWSWTPSKWNWFTICILLKKAEDEIKNRKRTQSKYTLKNENINGLYYGIKIMIFISDHGVFVKIHKWL